MYINIYKSYMIQRVLDGAIIDRNDDQTFNITSCKNKDTNDTCWSLSIDFG